MNSFSKWALGILTGIAGTTVLIISSFYLSISLNPLHVDVDFGTKTTWYGTFAQFGDTPETTVIATEALDVVRFRNIGLIIGYTKKDPDDNPGNVGRWKLTGFESGDYIVAAYLHVEGDNSRVGVYFLKKDGSQKGKEFYRGHIVEQDSSGVIAVCPYIFTTAWESRERITSMYSGILSACVDTKNLNLPGPNLASGRAQSQTLK
jgi:hypothetical protein